MSDAIQAVCANGHPMTGTNVYVPPGKPNQRQCRACRLEASRRAKRKDFASNVQATRRRKAATIEPAERLWMNSERGSGCWVWTGTTGSHGYGVVGHSRRTYLAHRFSYGLLVEPIPDGLTIDHLCLNKVCVNPSHMEVVTRGENARRGEKNRKTRSGGRYMANRTHCKNGHEFSPGNVRMAGSTRICLTCQTERMAKWKAARA